MRSYLLVFLLIIGCQFIHAQSGFYRNVFGDHHPNVNNHAPQLTSIDTVSDGGYILSASVGLGAQFCTRLKLDSAFNTVWSKSYATTSSAAFYNATELDDHGFVGIFIDSTLTYYLKTDSTGNVEFCKRYTLGPSGILSSGITCKSADNDSGYVSILGQCAMAYGLAKFDKHGETEWVAGYSSPLGFLGSDVYDIDLGLDSGYITTGQVINSATQQISAVIIHSDNNGQVIASKSILIDSASGVHTRITRFCWSESQQCYYATAGTFYGVPFINHKFIYILKLDADLNVVSSWRIDPPTLPTEIIVHNMEVAPDNNVVLNGMWQDSTNGVYKYYMMKFDPSNGNVVWSKSARGLISTQWYFSSTSIRGLSFFGPNDDILFGAFVNNDGNSIASIHSNGTGSCIAIDSSVTVAPASNWICRDLVVNNSPTSFISYPRSLAISDETFKDTLMCGTWTATQEVIPIYEELFNVTSNNAVTTLQSNSNEMLHVEIISATGQLVGRTTLAPNSSEEIMIPAVGVYFIRGYNTQKSHSIKIARF
jgi:hypothetical protein